MGGVDGVALTHLDQVSETAPVCRVYRGGEPASPLRPPAREDLACQERLGRWLAAVEPQLERLQRGELIAAVEAELGAPVALEADGPTAGDRRWRRTLS